MFNQEFYERNLENISAVDGRHCLITSPLRGFFSEHGLHRYRMLVEIKHLIKISKTPAFNLPSLSLSQEEELLDIFKNFTSKDSKAICQYDHFGRNEIGPLEHDVKSVEVYLREKLSNTEYGYLIPLIHFGFTSADVNNIAYNCMVKGALEKVYLPALFSLCDEIKILAEIHRKTLLLSRTHGQPASPTTFGKEMANFLQQLATEIKQLKELKLTAKMNGAVGNYNAHKVSYPNVDWITYSKEFVESFGFTCEFLSTQRGPKNKLVELFQTLIRINSIIKDLNVDFWLYVSQDLILQKKNETHVGSSVMPHKINPWLIECSEANTEISTALLEVFSREGQVSRLQRDLSDHDHERNYGAAFAYALIALDYTKKFIQNVDVNEELMLKELNANQKILSEAYQTILRRYGMSNAYDIFKIKFRNNSKVSLEQIHDTINSLDIKEEIKEQLKEVRVENYLGYAEELVGVAIHNYLQTRENL